MEAGRQRRLQVTVDGRVQGVGFRATTCLVASKFPVTGYVMNLPDGAVEIVAEGTERAINEFWIALRQSHVYRFVTSEHPHWGDASGRWTEFTTRHG